MIGTRLSNRYQLLRELGHGGMGVVYLAHDPFLDREVAIKLVLPTAVTREAAERLKHEARTVAKLDHPAIVVVHDIGEHEGALYFVMPFVAGRNLAALIHDQALKLGDVLDIGAQVADALDYSHGLGVVHRDVKPENILVERVDPQTVRVRITDFGLALARQDRRITKSGVAVGTVAYCSPEQVAAEEVDGRSDIYSLGTVLYQCLTGRTPFTGDVQAVLYRILKEDAAPPETVNPAVDAELSALVMRCLAKDPRDRFARASELGRGLTAYRARLSAGLSGQSLQSVSPAGPAYRPPPATKLVAREKEMAELTRRLNAALHAECQIVALGGEAGTGKTRLLDELEDVARARGIRVLHGRFVEHDRAFPYQGFCELLQEYFRSRGASSSGMPDFSDLAGPLVALFPVLSELPELRTSSSVPLETPRGARLEDRTHIFELLSRALTRLASGKPLVVLLEDLHAADVSLEALPYVVRRLGAAPVLFVCTYRSSEVGKHHPLRRMLDGFAGERRFAALSLAPLTPAEHRDFLTALTHGATTDPAFAAQIYDATEGNPYFTKELVLSLVETGAISRSESGSLSLSSGELVAPEALPKTIQQAVSKRVEHLPEPIQDVLSVASVLGRSFAYRDLALLAGGEESVEEAIERLVADGFLEEARAARGDRLAFVSGVLRDVLYANLPRRRRRQLHRGFAEELERQNAGRLERVYPQLLDHYSKGEVPAKVVEYGLKFAERSLAAWSGEEAGRAATAVLHALEDLEAGDSDLEVQARLLLAAAHRLAGDIDAAVRELDRARRAAHDPATGARICLAAAETAWEARRVEPAREWLERGIDAARAAREVDCLLRLLSLGATVANLRGEYGKARAYLDEVDALRPRVAEAEEVPRGGRLSVGLSVHVRAAEPADTKLIEEAEILANVFETLLTTDPQGGLVPRLVERWSAEEEGRAFLLTLRDDVRLSDGRPLTSALVAESMLRGIRRAAPALPAAYAALRGAAEVASGEADEVSGIELAGERALRLRLVEALPMYPALLTDVKTAVAVPLEGAEEPDATPIGTGPFRVAAFTANRIELERNERFWGEAPARLDGVDYSTGLQATQIAKGLRAGELDVARDLLPEDLDEMLRDRRLHAGLVEAPQKNTYFLLFSRRSELARRPELRRALAGVVRTHDLVRRALGRFAQPAEGLLPPGILGHDPGRRRRPITREKAAELLAAAQLSAPIRLRAAVHPTLQYRYASLTGALLKVWGDLGVTVSIETPTMTTYLEKGERNEGIDLLLGRWIADYDDPDNFTYGLFRTDGGRFRGFYSSPELDALIEEARGESRPSARERLYRRIEQQILDSGYLLPLFHEIDYRLAGPRVVGLKLFSTAPYVNTSTLGKTEATPARTGGRGTLTVPIVGEVHNLDPAMAFTVAQYEVTAAVFETLTRETEGARIAPWLAASYRTEDGGQRFRLRLREDVRFHDGRRLTARDVRFSFERLLASDESRNRELLSPIRGAAALIAGERGDLEGLQIVSAHEIVIDLERPLSFFPALLSHPSTAIVPEGTDPLDDSWKGRWVATGPFQVARFDPGRRLDLEANPAYWRRGLPRCDVLTFAFGVPPGEILAGFRSGRFALAWDLFPPDVELLQHDPEYLGRYRQTPRLSTYYLVFNTRSGRLADAGRRRELIDSLDVAALVRRHLGRLAMPAFSLIPPGLLGYEPALRPRGTPPSRGLGPSTDLTCIVHTAYEGPYSSLARDLFSSLGDHGYRVTTMASDRSDSERALAAPQADFLAGRWIADYPDSDSFVYGLLHGEAGLFGRLAGTPAIDRLIGLGRAETDPDRRHAIYQEIEERIAKDALLLPLFHEQAYRFARPEIDGFDVTFAQPIVAYEKLSVRR